MKIYEPCEVRVRLFENEDIITNSQQTTGVVFDSFGDSDWWKGGDKQ